MGNVNRSSLSDTPFNEIVNDFGTDRYVDGLVRFIKNSSTPITIALQGEWGSGKTSLMTRLKRALCSSSPDTPETPYIGIEINTWEYSMLSTPEETVFKIIERLVKEVSGKEQDSKKTWQIWRDWREFKHAAYRGIREGIKTIPGAGIVIEAAGVPTDLKDDTEDITLSDLKNSLENSVKNTLEKKKKQGVIVFVDDLDRLNPPVAVEILELLKNIFCIDNCIFVLAIDYEVVVKGLEPKFGKLTDKNEREFRSFFDKIIQVPFSLPVNSYRPMNFVFDSLVKIGYITAEETRDERIREPFTNIVNYSVGKNPRSIKRLINTLSLLSCIAQSGEEDNKEFTDSREGRIATFAIVALQICYPKIYQMVDFRPNFTKWDLVVCSKFNIQIHLENGDTPDWEKILKSACSPDNYLSQHHNDIHNLLVLIQKTGMKEGEEDEFEENIRGIIDKSSVTSITKPVSASEVNPKRLINTLHQKVGEKIKEKRPEIAEIKTRNNTGNGGFKLGYNGGIVDIPLQPKVGERFISLEMKLPTMTLRPNHLMEKSFDEMIKVPNIRNAMEVMDKCVAPLLIQTTNSFEGKLYNNPGPGTYFKSFSEEQAFCCNQGWMPEYVSLNVSYWINLPNEALFADNTIIETIADVIIATYDYRLTIMKW